MTTTNTGKIIDPSTFAAMVASGDDEQCGLHGVQDLRTAKQIVGRNARMKDLSNLLRCVSGSRFPLELLMHLMSECSFSAASLREFVQVFNREVDDLDFDDEARARVQDKYWSVRIYERIQKLDYQRAWELIKKSRWHFDDQGVVIGSASSMLTLQMVNALYEALSASGRILPVDECQQVDVVIEMPVRGVGFSNKALKAYPGIEFAHSIGGLMRGVLTARGRKVVAIASYLNKVRRDKRRKKAVVHAFG